MCIHDKHVKIELNGKPVGEQSVDDSKSITATFEVPYEPGTLTARCLITVLKHHLKQLRLLESLQQSGFMLTGPQLKADRNDLSYVMVEITDAEGNVIPDDDNTMVNFEISGNGKIAGVGSGSPTDMSSFQQPRKKTWQGRCLVIVSPEVKPGGIILKAKSTGLKESSLEIKAE